VRDSSHPDTTDDESSHHSSDETEILSSSDHDADSSEEDEVEPETEATSSASAAYMNFVPRVTRKRPSRRFKKGDSTVGPYIALPPLERDDESEGRDSQVHHRHRRLGGSKEPSDSSTSSVESEDAPTLIHLMPVTRPIDLTTDHSAYNPAEVTAVLRRCKNAPRAISAGVGK
jgi:hypothetical protein